MSEFDVATLDFSLTRGGPFYRLLLRLGLARNDGRDAVRQARAYIAVGWLPLIGLALLDGSAFSAPEAVGWHALPLHVRFLVAIPLLTFGEQLLEERCRRAIDSVGVEEFGAHAPREVAQCARAAERLRDSIHAELGLIAVVIATRFLFWSITGKTVFISDYSAQATSTATALWHGLVSLPLFSFVLLRWLWRWAIWVWLMRRIARLRLRLIASHPDAAGGFGRLAAPSFAIAPLVAGFSAVLAASWGSDIVFAHAELTTFIVDFILLLIAGELLAILPMLPFVRALTRARFDGRDDYGRFALAYTRLFHERWIDRGEREGLLGTPDISGLADLIASVQHVDGLRIIPFGKEHALAVLVCALVPMLPLPLLAANVPVQDLLERTIMTLLFG